MKSFFTIFTIIVCLFMTTNVFCCFMDQPQNMLPKIVSADFSNGASWQVQFPNRKTDKIPAYNGRMFFWYNDNLQTTNIDEGWLSKWFASNSITEDNKQFYKHAEVLASFPLTINCSFNPFQITKEDVLTSNRVLRDANGNAIQLENGLSMDDQSKITRFCLLYWGKNKKWTVLKDIKNPNYQIIMNTSHKTSMFGKYVFQNKYGFKQNQIMFIVAYFETQNGFKTPPQGLNTLIQKRPHEINGVIRVGVLQNQKPR